MILDFVTAGYKIVHFKLHKNDPFHNHTASKMFSGSSFCFYDTICVGSEAIIQLTVVLYFVDNTS